MVGEAESSMKTGALPICFIGLDDLGPLLLRQVTLAQSREVDLRARAEDAQRQLLLSHLEREDAHRLALAQRHDAGRC